MEQAGPAALGTVFVVASQVRQQVGQQEVQVKGGLLVGGGSASVGCLWGQQHWPWVLQAMALAALQGADQASRGAHLRVLGEACLALPYHGAYCNLEGLVLDLGQDQGQSQGQVLWQILRVEVVLASAAAFQASDACLARPSAGGQAMVGLWPTSYRPLSEL